MCVCLKVVCANRTLKPFFLLLLLFYIFWNKWKNGLNYVWESFQSHFTSQMMCLPSPLAVSSWLWPKQQPSGNKQLKWVSSAGREGGRSVRDRVRTQSRAMAPSQQERLDEVAYLWDASLGRYAWYVSLRGGPGHTGGTVPLRWPVSPLWFLEEVSVKRGGQGMSA